MPPKIWNQNRTKPPTAKEQADFIENHLKPLIASGKATGEGIQGSDYIIIDQAEYEEIKKEQGWTEEQGQQWLSGKEPLPKVRWPK